MKRVSAKFVPRILTPEQKQQRLSILLELRDRVTSDPNFFQNLKTGDESWVYGYDPETKVQSSQWKTLNSPRPKKVRQLKANVKVMLIVFFDLEGIVGRSSYLVALQSTLHIIKVCWNVYGTMYAEKVRRSWQMISCCTTTMLHATFPFSSISYSRTKKITVCPHPP
jgi:histone-lysine N-methyltransferase SETMAR